ncbi:NDR1/HIN1-like protein 26 [Impatiens glandulifera]|uniref:NDR1/HIN1-like protein 26 n=1 Tax=Impatiens glandulifera TaxID=253017 RepID=UPI001FB0CEA1|nr:NDR1/HIN1-like protein 26 [Impatiens glandulifera]
MNSSPLIKPVSVHHLHNLSLCYILSGGNMLPVQKNNVGDRRQVHRTHSAKYYIDRVHDTLTTRVSKLICAVIIGLLIIISILTFILWLSLRPHRPKFHVREFSIPALAQANGFDGAQVIFNITARNPNLNVGYYYDDAMQVVLYYQDEDIGSTTLLHPFLQEPKNETILYGVLSGPTLLMNNQRWMQFQADRAKGAVIFRLSVSSTIRFKVSSWNSHSHKIHVNCEVGVGPDGLLLPRYINIKKCPVYFS